MDLGMEISVFLAYTAGMLLLYFCGRVLFIPLKIVARILLCSVMGGVMLVVLRILGGRWGLILPVNPLNALIAGVCGAPGVLAMLFYFNV